MRKYHFNMLNTVATVLRLHIGLHQSNGMTWKKDKTIRTTSSPNTDRQLYTEIWRNNLSRTESSLFPTLCFCYSLISKSLIAITSMYAVYINCICSCHYRGGIKIFKTIKTCHTCSNKQLTHYTNLGCSIYRATMTIYFHDAEIIPEGPHSFGSVSTIGSPHHFRWSYQDICSTTRQ